MVSYKILLVDAEKGIVTFMKKFYESRGNRHYNEWRTKQAIIFR